MVVKVLSPTMNGVFSEEILNCNVNSEDLECFKKSLGKYLGIVDYYNKNEKGLEKETNNFLSEIYQNKYYVNSKDTIDIAIFSESKPDSDLSVIIEVKSPNNINEMIQGDDKIEDINVKAIHELARYYSLEAENYSHSISHLIATNGYVWYFFNSNDFRNTFYTKKSLLKFKTNAANYYDECSKYLSKLDLNWKCVRIDLRDYESEIKSISSSPSNDLLLLYRLFSPEYLLGKEIKEKHTYTLNKEFYDELLYILGLEEYTDSETKKLQIRGSKLENPGSILYNIIDKIKTDDSLNDVPNLSSYGKTSDEQLFNISLDLCLTWLNRILFLKLLEGQMKRYHKNDVDKVSFMSSSNISSFDELYTLFFQVFAVPLAEREKIANIPNKFRNLPYLNSSLFDQTILEKKVCKIYALSNDIDMPLYNKSIISNKGGHGKPLWYLLEFLDKFDFSGDSSKIIDKNRNKSLINATVLGLIFEKINGYKEGSYYTPGDITMYICRDTIENTIINKFNKNRKNNTAEIESLVDIYNNIEREWTIQEANSIINEIKICDPAVGSGHFLVSALNEILRIKSELGILCDASGKVLRGVNLSIENDELIVSIDDGELFEYNPNRSDNANIQKTIFSEKRTIIENCLFGVDLNPKSVSICRLRLWIELLKNTYYQENGELETLPNIDINIKQGDSLISRYDLNIPYSNLQKWGVVDSVNDMKAANIGYKTAINNKIKRENKELIAKYESDRAKTWNREAERVSHKILTLKDELVSAKSKIKEQVGIDGSVSKKYIQDVKKRIKKIESQITTEENKLKKYSDEGIYTNAFEWRFAFPEILDNDGKFIGFDCVIGNPPYIRVQAIDKDVIDYITKRWSVVAGKFDISLPFIELGYSLLSSDGYLSYISSNQYFVSAYGKEIRKFFVKTKSLAKIVDFGDLHIFENATTYTAIISLNRCANETIKYTKITELPIDEKSIPTYSEILVSKLGAEPWALGSSIELAIMKKIMDSSDIKLHEIAKAKYGIISGNDSLLTTKTLVKKLNVENDMQLPLIRPEGLGRYCQPNPTRYCFYPYKLVNNKTTLLPLEEIKTKYPLAYKFIQDNKELLIKRKDSRKELGSKQGWYGLVRFSSLSIFREMKILTPGEVKVNKFSLDSGGYGYFGARTVAIALKKEINQNPDIDIKFLLALLNSRLIEMYLHHVSPPKNGGYYGYSVEVLNRIPIVLNNVDQSYFVNLVDKILEEKKSNPNADTHEYEDMIDNKIFEIYNLSPQEINYIKQG